MFSNLMIMTFSSVSHVLWLSEHPRNPGGTAANVVTIYYAIFSSFCQDILL